MVHRGPDDDGVHTDPGGLSLGARRLSVIDVQHGHQPLSNEDGSIWAALNGEIYNHPELRAGLERRGHRFATKSDTEVLVHLYEEHGDALVHALEGMFAFAIWDARRHILLLARDRFGEKPLFYAAQDGQLAFASEVTALCAGLPRPSPDLDPRAVTAFLTLGYIPGTMSIRQDIRMLPVAHTLTWRADRREPVLARYWRLSDAAPTAPRPLHDAVAEVDAALERSVRRRLIADVPVGVLLSGGLDSALVAAHATRVSGAPIRTFTVGYDVGTVSEVRPARRVADLLGSQHRELTLSQADVAHSLSGVMGSLDQPIADPAFVALHAVCRLAREDVTVVVGGEGADELFGGYPRYRWLARSVGLEAVPAPVRSVAARGLSRLPITGRGVRLRDVVKPADVVDRHLRWVTSGRWKSAISTLGPRSAAAPFDAVADAQAALGVSSATCTAGRFMALDRERWLPDNVLAKADRASMRVSLEMRTPFLDRELAELSAEVDPTTHLSGGGKRLLREALVIAVPELRRGPSKTAFRVPTAEWLRGTLRPALLEHVLHGRACSDGWLAPESIRTAMEDHDAGGDRTDVLWPALTFGLWLDAQ